MVRDLLIRDMREKNFPANTDKAKFDNLNLFG